MARKVTLEVVRGQVTGPWSPTYGARWVDLILRKLKSWCRGLAMKSPKLTSLEVLLWLQCAGGQDQGWGRQGAARGPCGPLTRGGAGPLSRVGWGGGGG